MTECTIRGSRLFYWDPRRNKLPLVRRWEIGHRVGNFGDLLGPLVVGSVLGLPFTRSVTPTRPGGTARVFSVGSVMHFARDGDVIWGTGVNGKIPDDAHRFASLDVRAVRGPLTRDWLSSRKHLEVPEVYGDPALLVPHVAPETREWATAKKRELGVVPNFHDVATYASHPGFIDPRREPWAVVRDILASEYVAASSLHGVVLAEAHGIPAALLPASSESPFKYVDYARGTGREALVAVDDASSAREALAGRGDPLAAWDHRPLLDAFPRDSFD